MKRDLDLVRRILIELEAMDKRPTGAFELDGVEYKRVSYHVKLLVQAGLVEAADATHRQSPVQPEYIAPQLTAAGHDFLDAIRADNVWTKTKAAVGDALTTASLTLVGEKALQVGRKILGLP